MALAPGAAAHLEAQCRGPWTGYLPPTFRCSPVVATARDQRRAWAAGVGRAERSRSLQNCCTRQDSPGSERASARPAVVGCVVMAAAVHPPSEMETGAALPARAGFPESGCARPTLGAWAPHRHSQALEGRPVGGRICLAYCPELPAHGAQGSAAPLPAGPKSGLEGFGNQPRRALVKWTGLAAIGAVILIQFFPLWWLCIIGSALCVLVAGLLEQENDRLRAELALYKEVQRLDLGTLSSPAPPTDALDRRRRG